MGFLATASRAGRHFLDVREAHHLFEFLSARFAHIFINGHFSHLYYTGVWYQVYPHFPFPSILSNPVQTNTPAWPKEQFSLKRIDARPQAQYSRHIWFVTQTGLHMEIFS